uniref:Kallikrein related peptidase 15 n=1 Tax=Sarcophilus harrisii TaxID=9305 RepID=A0A7N4NZG4_SARHA
MARSLGHFRERCWKSCLRFEAVGCPEATSQVLGFLSLCDLSQDNDKVIGGEECRPHSQPWQVALFEGSRFNCGASLISNQWVLTAAHCNTGKIRVRLGEHNLRLWDGVEQLRGVAYAFPHPRYEKRGHHDDIMLLRLNRPVCLSNSIRPVALPTRCPRQGEQCVVSGWGLDPPSIPRVKLQVWVIKSPVDIDKDF